MVTQNLMRRRPGQGGCCGCGLGALLGLGALALTGVWKLARRGRRS